MGHILPSQTVSTQQAGAHGTTVESMLAVDEPVARILPGSTGRLHDAVQRDLGNGDDLSHRLSPVSSHPKMRAAIGRSLRLPVQVVSMSSRARERLRWSRLCAARSVPPVCRGVRQCRHRELIMACCDSGGARRRSHTDVRRADRAAGEHAWARRGGRLPPRPA